MTIQKVAELLVNAVLTDTAKTGFASLIQHTFAQEKYVLFVLYYDNHIWEIHVEFCAFNVTLFLFL